MVEFGGPVESLDIPGRSPAGDMRFIRERLASLGMGGSGALRLYRPRATAAFSRLDSMRPGYEIARSVVRSYGFEPVLRPSGGHLAVYGPGTLVIDLVAAHPDPRKTAIRRSANFAGLLANALRNGGLEPALGAIPGEYCPGSQSISARGCKIAGLGQRLTTNGYHLGAIVMLQDSQAARIALRPAYHALGLPFDPASVGAACDVNPAFDAREFEVGLREILVRSLNLAQARSAELFNGG